MIPGKVKNGRVELGTRERKASLRVLYQVGAATGWLVLGCAWTLLCLKQGIFSELLVLIKKGGNICPLTAVPLRWRVFLLVLMFLSRTCMNAQQVPVGITRWHQRSPRKERRSVLAAAVCTEPCLESVWATAAVAGTEAKGTCAGTRCMVHKSVTSVRLKEAHIWNAHHSFWEWLMYPGMCFCSPSSYPPNSKPSPNKLRLKLPFNLQWLTEHCLAAGSILGTGAHSSEQDHSFFALKKLIF